MQRGESVQGANSLLDSVSRKGAEKAREIRRHSISCVNMVRSMCVSKVPEVSSSAAFILQQISVPSRATLMDASNRLRERHCSLSDGDTTHTGGIARYMGGHHSATDIGKNERQNNEQNGKSAKDSRKSLLGSQSSTLCTIKENNDLKPDSGYSVKANFKCDVGVISRRSTSPNIPVMEKKHFPKSLTVATFTSLEQEDGQNKTIESLLQTDGVHQESLRQKQRLNLLVQQIQRQTRQDAATTSPPTYPGARKRLRALDRTVALQARDNEPTDGDSTDEILTLFEAMKGITFCRPSYWVGCSYVFLAISKRVEVKIRQTGVMPCVASETNFKKLTLQVSLLRKAAQKQNVTLLKSSKDTSFRSHRIVFKHVEAEDVKKLSVRLRVFSPNGALRKKLVDEWTVPLKDCEAIFEHTNWRRCQF